MSKKSQFYLRRLHGVTGIFPLGYFLYYHLQSMASISSENILYAFIFLWLPLLYHSLYGMYITYEGSINIGCYSYWRNYMYFFQRWTGIFIFLFLIWHVYIMKFGSFSDTTLNSFILFCGVLMSIFHVSNGIFGFLVDMGLVVGDKAQKVAVGISMIFFIIFAFYGIHKFYNFIQ
jgi:succinate dehydrogenase / fumarate reductase cytochrome b subunit